jgi:hypothetical protein
VKRRSAQVRRRGWLFRITKRLVQAALLAVFLSIVFSTLFIGLKCFSTDTRAQAPSLAVQRTQGKLKDYVQREEASTFLTLPEWYIVYNTEEYARFTAAKSPSRFPYVGSIRQYWRYYGAMCDATAGTYPFSAGNHVMLSVIGSSFTIEYLLKGLYENTIGRLSEAVSGRNTPEDIFAQKTAAEYGAFMHTVPWYRFPFFAKVGQMWRETPASGSQIVRKWERKLALTAEYAGKGIYGWLIGISSGAAYGADQERVHVWIENASDAAFADGVVQKVHQMGPRSFIVTLPRYEAFTARAKMLARQQVRFVEIAGNDEILVSIVAPAAVERDSTLTVRFDEPFLTDASRRRTALSVAVRSLHDIILKLEQRGAVVEHIYDY